MNIQSQRLKHTVCIHCNHELSLDARFCGYCGKENSAMYLENDLDSETRCKFYLEIWSKGAFQRDLFTAMPLVKRESIERFVQIEHIKGHVTIIDLKNPATSQLEKFYIISDDNIRQLLLQICKDAKMLNDTKNQDIIREILRLHKKNDFETPVLEEIPTSLGNNDYNRAHFELLRKNNIYLLVWMLKTCPTIKKQAQLNKFLANAIVNLMKIKSSIYF